MAKRNYWTHNTPEGVEPWEFMKRQAIHYIYAGENLAYGFTDVNTTVDSWMKSPSHKKNILTDTFTHVGYAVCKSDNYQNNGEQLIIVQHFRG